MRLRLPPCRSCVLALLALGAIASSSYASAATSYDFSTDVNATEGTLAASASSLKGLVHAQESGSSSESQKTLSSASSQIDAVAQGSNGFGHVTYIGSSAGESESDDEDEDTDFSSDGSSTGLMDLADSLRLRLHIGA